MSERTIEVGDVFEDKDKRNGVRHVTVLETDGVRARVQSHYPDGEREGAVSTVALASLRFRFRLLEG